MQEPLSMFLRPLTCVPVQVPGKVNLRGDRLERLQSLNTEREDQFLPRQRRNVTYVSRLQSVQAAVDHQVGEMQRDHPGRRVALVSFSNDVSVTTCHKPGLYHVFRIIAVSEN